MIYSSGVERGRKQVGEVLQRMVLKAVVLYMCLSTHLWEIWQLHTNLQPVAASRTEGERRHSQLCMIMRYLDLIQVCIIFILKSNKPS